MVEFINALGLSERYNLLLFGIYSSPSKDEDASKWMPISSEAISNKIDAWTTSRGKRYNDFTLSELATKIKVPARVLRHYFRHEIKTDFRRWKTAMRIKEAGEVIRDDHKKSIEAIADDLGFDDKSNFFRQFKRYTGLTPRQWRFKKQADAQDAKDPEQL